MSAEPDCPTVYVKSIFSLQPISIHGDEDPMTCNIDDWPQKRRERAVSLAKEMGYGVLVEKRRCREYLLIYTACDLGEYWNRLEEASAPV